jgi:predicted membrane protein
MPNNYVGELTSARTLHQSQRFAKKNLSFSLIERVILSAGAMLIFSVSFQIDQMSEDEVVGNLLAYIDVKCVLLFWDADALRRDKAANGT